MKLLKKTIKKIKFKWCWKKIRKIRKASMEIRNRQIK